MDKVTISTFRKRLLRHGRALLRAGGRPGDPLAGLAEGHRRQLGQVHAALERIERGQFGRCEGCHRTVEIERLELAPWEPHCRGCADLGMPAQLAV
jgi:hypothetical protein